MRRDPWRTLESGLDVARFVWMHPANRRRRIRALATFVTWQLYKRATGRYWDLRVFGGMRLRCYPDSTSASLLLYCAGSPDYHEMAFMRRYLREGDGFIDGGANVGVYTLLAASLVKERGKVEAFEPGPTALGRLRENVALNACPQVLVHSVALSSSSGNVTFLRDRDTTNRIATEADEGARVMTVPCVLLDDALEHGHYAMGKLDLEGAEWLALRGAERMLAAANPPVWLLEMNGSLHAYGFEEAQLAEWLKDRGYELALYDADSGDLRFDSRPWLLRHNVLAIAAALRKEVLDRLRARP